MGFFFSKVAGCDLTEKRTSSQFLSSECFFQFSSIVKHLRANTTVPFRPLWGFICVLKEVTVFIQVNLDSCLVQLYSNINYLANKTNIDLLSWKKIGTYHVFSKNIAVESCLIKSYGNALLETFRKNTYSENYENKFSTKVPFW